MRLAYLDCFSGISGDMFLGAAVDAGVSLEKLQEVAASLGLGVELKAQPAMRSGIRATKVDVIVGGKVDEPADVAAAHSHHEPHGHEHSHGDSHSHAHPHAHEHHDHVHEGEAHEHHAHGDKSAHGHDHAHVHRGLKEIRHIIGHARVSERAKKFALRAFELLAESEGKIHNRPAEEIHFHEVGSEDAITDIVCAAAAVELLGIDAWYCSPLNVGSGTVKCAHGVLPVPAPATAELLKGAPVYSSGVPKELLTPTGAALLRALEVKFEPLPAMTARAAGYGAGARDLPSQANVLRLTVGEALSAAKSDTVVVLEANLDDMNPQLVGFVQQKLLDAGALDAFAVPVQMKKGRPGVVLTALSAAAHAETLTRILLTETTTLGVRQREETRRILEREFVTAITPWGEVAVKLGLLEGRVVNCAPEFEDCRKLAEAHGVPLKLVLQEAMRSYLSSTGAAADAAGAGERNSSLS